MTFKKGNDDVRGDSTPMPDRGTGTAMTGDTMGCDTNVDATNPCGKITGATKSDDCCKNMPHKSETL